MPSQLGPSHKRTPQSSVTRALHKCKHPCAAFTSRMGTVSGLFENANLLGTEEQIRVKLA